MTYDAQLAERIRNLLKDETLVEKKMFGGTGYLLNGNMACGVHGDKLIVRVGAEKYSQCLALPAAKPFDLTGKAMTGWVEVLPPGTQDDESLGVWIRRGLEYAQTLPPKNL